MSTHRKTSTLSRREFIKTFGLVTSAAAATPILSKIETFGAQRAWAGSGLKVKIGVLLPPSKVYPELGENLLAGMRLFFQQAGMEASIIVEPVGFGPNSALQKSQKLIEEDGANLVVGAVSAPATAGIRDLFDSRQALFINSSVGENGLDPNYHSPFVFHNSLSYWQASQVMGKWAAWSLGRKAIVATSLYDSGYDMLYAFRSGFEAAGGEILQTTTTHILPDHNYLDRLMEEIEQTRPDFVYAFYCGEPAADFVSAYTAARLAGKIPLAGSGFLTEDYILPTLGGAAKGILTCMPWASSLDSPENRDFQRDYQEANDRPADVFSVLGYDTARLAGEAANAAQGDWKATSRWIEAMEGAAFASPRGELRMDPLTHRVMTPLYLRQVALQSGAPANRVLGEMEPISASAERAQEQIQGLKTGWLNAYLSL